MVRPLRQADGGVGRGPGGPPHRANESEPIAAGPDPKTDKGPRKNNFTFSYCTWLQMWGRLQRVRDFSPAGETRMNAAAGGLKPRRRLKPAEACPTWTGGPTLARKCE